MSIVVPLSLFRVLHVYLYHLSFSAVRKLAAFDTIDWHNLLEMEAPFIPQPDDLTDTSYFEGQLLLAQLHSSFYAK